MGALGIGVQLAVLLALKNGFHLSYLLATALAVEAAVVHNFLWHERYTWADRVQPSWRKSLPRLLRFNLTNGGISIMGNLALMKLLVGVGQMNYLLANGIAIAVCSLLNFLVSERWVFASGSRTGADHEKQFSIQKRIGIAAGLCVISVLGCHEASAQVQNSPSSSEEQTAADIFANVLEREWHPMKRMVRLNLAALCERNSFKYPNKRQWGMGFEDFERIAYSSDAKLENKFHDLVSDWKAGRRRRAQSFYKDKFPNVHRFAIQGCGSASGSTTIVVAVYLSGWDAWKQSVALLLGR